MQEVINSGKIHQLTRRAFEEGKKVIIHKGGTGSGKTFDLMIFLLFYAASNPNWIITVVSESKPHLDIGAIRYAKLLIANAGLTGTITYNETKGFFTFPNGTILEFFSADRIDKALGARRNLLYGNEINSLKLNVWDELARRSDYVIGDFNPTAEFWLERWLQYNDDTIVIKSNHLSNPFLNPIERAKIVKRAEADPNFKRIHIDCEYGSSDDLVIPSFTTSDTITPDGAMCYGLDFGYSNDPTALVQVVKAGDDIHVRQLIYRTGLLNRDIIALMREAGIRPGYDEIFADCAEPKSIEEIRQAGFNVKPADKGKDSIMGGVQFLNAHRLHVTKDSTDLIKELRNYTYITDSEGKPTNKPVDAYNHAIDALRYAVYTKFRPQQKEISYLRTSNRINK